MRGEYASFKFRMLFSFGRRSEVDCLRLFCRLAYEWDCIRESFFDGSSQDPSFDTLPEVIPESLWTTFRGARAIGGFLNADLSAGFNADAGGFNADTGFKADLIYGLSALSCFTERLSFLSPTLRDLFYENFFFSSSELTKAFNYGIEILWFRMISGV